MGSVPENVIVMWAGTHSDANNLTGWSRETGLDSKMTKGAASATTNAGADGGGSSHSHDTSNHDHVQPAHVHVGQTQLPTKNQNWPNSPRAYANSHGTRRGHKHNFNTGSAAAPDSGNATFTTWGTAAMEPEYFEVIYIKSDGTGDGFPDDCIVYYDSGTDPTNWTQHAASVDKYFRGAGSGGNGGGTGGNATHDHSPGSHTHSIDNHVHGASNTTTGSVLGFNYDNSPSNASFSVGNSPVGSLATGHPHSTAATSSSGSGNSGGMVSGGDSGTHNNNLILSTKMNAIQNDSGGSVWLEGAYCLWLGDYGDVPTGDDFVIADGNNSTRNLLGRFILNEPADNADHGDPTGALAHIHNSEGHTHTANHGHAAVAIGNSPNETTTFAFNYTSPSDQVYAQHGHPNTGNMGSADPGLDAREPALVSNDTAEPAHKVVLYIMSGEEPVSAGDAIGFGANF